MAGKDTGPTIRLKEGRKPLPRFDIRQYSWPGERFSDAVYTELCPIARPSLAGPAEWVDANPTAYRGILPPTPSCCSDIRE